MRRTSYRRETDARVLRREADRAERLREAEYRGADAARRGGPGPADEISDADWAAILTDKAARLAAAADAAPADYMARQAARDAAEAARVARNALRPPTTAEVLERLAATVGTPLARFADPSYHAFEYRSRAAAYVKPLAAARKAYAAIRDGADAVGELERLAVVVPGVELNALRHLIACVRRGRREW